MVQRLICLAAIWAVIFFALPASAKTEPPALAGGRATGQGVVSVSFQGFDELPMDELKRRLETKGPAGLVGGSLPRFDREAMERDAATLARLFRRYGYYEAKVTAKTAPGTQKNSLRVAFSARPGPITRVKSIAIRYTNREAEEAWRSLLLKQLKLAKGDPLLIKRYEETKKAMGQALSEHAHPLARVTGRVFVRPKEHLAELVFLVDPGERLLFGRATLEGNKRIAEHIVMRSKTFARGEPFSAASLQETRRALFDTGFFRSVILRPLFRERADGQVPVLIRVVEQDAHSLRLGLGYGTEDEFRFRTRYLFRNPMGLGDTLSVEGKLSAIYEGLETRWSVPNLFNRKSKLVLVWGSSQPDYEAYEARLRYITPTIHYQLASSWNVFLGYNMEDARVLKLKSNVSDPDYEKQSFFISSLKGGISFDSRDNPLNPTKGTYILVKAELASAALGSELGFIRPEAEIRHIIDLGFVRDKWLLALRAKGGMVEPSLEQDSVPIIRRFFPGGANSVRGYPYQRLGPLDSSGNPTGGDWMAELSAEVRFPLYRSLGGVLFLDAGNAWENPGEEQLTFRYAAGFGFRYHTPVGPVRVDFGFPLNLPGNSHIDSWQFFLSVGQAF